MATRQGSARDFLIDALGTTAMLMIARGRRSAEASEPLGGPISAEPAD